MLDALIWKFSHSLLYGGEALDLWGCETLSCCQKKPPAFNIIFVNFATNYWWDWKKENPGVGFLGIWKENTVIACRPNHQRGNQEKKKEDNKFTLVE